MSILFKNAFILIRDKLDYQVLSNAYLGVKEDKIVYIGGDEPKEEYDVIKDMTNKLLMPGLVNAHGHSAMTILRGLGSNRKLHDWLDNVIFPIEEKFNETQCLVGNRLACLEMIRSGTTTFTDMYAFSYTTLKAAAESGLNVNSSVCGLAFDSNQSIDETPRYPKILRLQNLFDNQEGNIDLYNELKVHKVPKDIEEGIKSKRLMNSLSIHSEYLSTPNFVKGIKQLNDKLHKTIDIHISETLEEHNECIKKYGKTPIEYFNSFGILDGGYVHAAHCVYVTDHDLELIKKSGTSIVHNPTSNMKLGSGFAPISKAIKMGINVALGTDGCASNNNLDMFEEMHVAALINCGITNDAAALSVTDILDMATINGAKALHRFDTGRLEVGYKADIIALDLNAPHLCPKTDIPSLLVYSAHSSDVCLTMANGKMLYEDGKYFTLDVKEIMEEAQKIAKELICE